jgi:hypothetical protein
MRMFLPKRFLSGARRVFTGLLCAVLIIASGLPADSLTPQRRALLGGAGVPTWASHGASIDIDLINNRAYVAGSGVVAPSTLLSVTRAGSETVTDASGSVSYAGSGVLARSSAGLQIYPGSTNLLLHNSAFNNATWSSIHVTPVDNSAIAPDGTMTASTITADGTSNAHVFQQVQSFSNGTIYSVSGYAKAVTARYLQILFSPTANNFLQYATVDLQTGATFATTGSGTIVINVLSDANGYFYFSVQAGPIAGAPTNLVFGMVPALNSARAAVSTLSGTINVWNLQNEALPASTPVIPTTTGSASRPADNISAAGAFATAIAVSTGTISVTTASAIQGHAATFVDANGTMLLGKSALDNAVTAVGSSLGSVTAANWRVGTNTTATLTWDGAGGSIQLASGTPGADAISRSPTGPFYIGSTSGSSNFLYGNITRITFYPTKQSLVATAATPFRSFASLTPYSGNPVVPYNTIATNTTGGDAPYINTNQLIGGVYYALSEGNTGSLSGSTAYNYINIYTTTDFQTFTPNAASPAIRATSSAWDDHYLGHPAIIKLGSTWYAFYSGMNAAGTTENIGVATSSDFLTWTKYGSNPIITDNVAIPAIIQIGSTLYLYVADRPSGHTISYYTTSVNTPLGPWVRGDFAIQTLPADWFSGNSRLNDPYVTLNPQGFYEMMFTVENQSIPSPYTGQSTAYAISTDGINWTKFQSAVLQGNGIVGNPTGKYPGDPLLFFNGSSVWLYWAGENLSSISQGCLGKIIP